MTRRSGGWPLTMFLTPGGAPFSAAPISRKKGATDLPGFLDLLPRGRRGLPRARRRHRRAGGAAGRTRSQSLEPAPRRRRRIAERPPAPVALAELKRAVRPGARRFRRRAQVSARDRSRASACANMRARGDADALADGAHHARADGGRRHPRSAGRRLLPLQRRRRMDDSAFREDALRQRSAARRCTRIWRERPAMPRFATVARGIVDWMTREMQCRDGALLLEPRRRQRGRGRQVLRLDARTRCARCSRPMRSTRSPHRTTGSTAAEFRGPCVEPARERVARRHRGAHCDPACRRRAHGSRQRRPRCSPHASETRATGLDDKILTSWNALAIAGLARAARALRRCRHGPISPARPPMRCAHAAWRDGRLLATGEGERAHLNAYLDDYAFLLQALLELMQTRFRVEDYAWARELADVLLDEFEDPSTAASSSRATTTSGCSTGRSPATTMRRPSGNGVAAECRSSCSAISARGAALRRCGRAARCGFFSPVLARARPRDSRRCWGARRSHPAASVQISGRESPSASPAASCLRAIRRCCIFNIAGVPLP